jgi:hypothetical protein
VVREYIWFDNFWGGAMRMRAIAALGAGLVLVAGAIAAQAAPPNQDIFGTDPNTGLIDFGKCQDSIAPRGFPMGVAIYVRLGGAAANGISGAEFFVQERGPTGTNIPVFLSTASGGLGWTVSIIANPNAAVTTGHPFVETGSPPNTDKRAGIAFAVDPNTGEGCQHGDADAPPGMVKLYDVTISKTTLGNPIPPDTYMWIGPGIPPGSPLFNCPLVNLCDTPAFTKVCLPSGGGQFIINPSTRTCTVGTEPKAWSEVKALYR